MNYIVLIIAMTLSFILGAFLCLKSLQFGLRWKIQVENKETPTIDNPIEKVVDNIQVANLQRQVDAMNREQERINKEWMFGKEGE